MYGIVNCGEYLAGFNPITGFASWSRDRAACKAFTLADAERFADGIGCVFKLYSLGGG